MAKIGKKQRKELELIAQERAGELRRAWGLGIEPVSDIFELIERRVKNVTVLRYPALSPDLSAFVTVSGDDCLVYINTNMPYGHQVFSATHELSHLLYDKEHLKLLVCRPGEDSEDEREVLADLFAGTFLLPAEGVRHVYYSLFGPRHRVTHGTVMALQGTFKVSYAAMLYALLKNGIITPPVYGHLKKIGAKENVSQMQQVARMYGVEELVTPLGEKIIPKSLLLALNSNYKEGRISFNKLGSVLALWEKKPEEMGFAYEDPV
ncbi:MAG: ImmA/IrrE family metallo-endopeptidase [Eubacteriales bacterium]